VVGMDGSDPRDAPEAPLRSYRVGRQVQRRCTITGQSLCGLHPRRKWAGGWTPRPIDDPGPPERRYSPTCKTRWRSYERPLSNGRRDLAVTTGRGTKPHRQFSRRESGMARLVEIHDHIYPTERETQEEIPCRRTRGQKEERRSAAEVML